MLQILMFLKEVLTKIKKFNRLDILINNSGGPPMGSFFKQNDKSWDIAINQNY